MKNAAGKGLLCALPCFLAAILNPPILALIFKNSTLDYSGGKMAAYALMFAAECVCVAAFEETLFRGAVFLTLLENRRNGGARILASAAGFVGNFCGCAYSEFFYCRTRCGTFADRVFVLLGGMCAYTLICTKISATALLCTRYSIFAARLPKNSATAAGRLCRSSLSPAFSAWLWRRSCYAAFSV